MSEFKLNEDGTIQRPPKTKVMLVSYSSGIPTFCPKCNSENILIFFGRDFPPNLIENWCEKIHADKVILCNQWEIILKTMSSKGCTSNSNPNWVCKNCYDGGVVIEKT